MLPPGTDKLVAAGSFHTPDTESSLSPVRESEDSNGQPRHKRKKSTKGWDGEVVHPALRNSFLAEADGALLLYPRRSPVDSRHADPMFSTYRTLETTANADGSATTHAVVRCTLADIAQATGLRVEDAAFALNECGLLVRRRQIDEPRDREHGEEQADGGEEGETTNECVVISRAMVEAVAQERGVKKMCMDLAHVLL